MVEGNPLRILAETAYPPTVASARVRLDNHGPFLAEHGVALTYRPNLGDGEYRELTSGVSPARKAKVLLASATRTTRRRPDHELLVVHRLRFLTPVPGLDPPPRLDAYDFDDALFLGSVAPVNRRFAWAKREAQRCIAYLRRARVVIAGNSILASAARQYSRRVEVIPSCVDPTRQPLHRHGVSEPVTIGWIGSPTTSAYLQPLLPVVARINAERLRAKLVVVGADTGARAQWIEHHPWSLKSEPKHLSRFDIGVMPQPDDEWARGKCGYKVLQYFSAGVPAIASPVGVVAELVGSERGLLADTEAQWRTALTALLSDVDERRQRGGAARAFVERQFSYQRWAPELARLLHSLAV